MEKVFKVISNSMLTVFLFGIMLIPIASMAVMGLKVQENEKVLSVKDSRETVETGETRETTESANDESTGLEEINY